MEEVKRLDWYNCKDCDSRRSPDRPCVDIMDPCILGSDALEQLDATVDTVAKWLLINTGASGMYERDSLATVSHEAKELHSSNNLITLGFAA